MYGVIDDNTELYNFVPKQRMFLRNYCLKISLPSECDKFLIK